jgi:acetolactate synthase-1/3 small subunit
MDLNVSDAIEVEIGLIKVHANDESRAQILQCVQATDAKIIDVTDKTYTIQVCGNDKNVNAALELLKPFGIKEFVCSGKVAVSKAVSF